MVSQKPEGKNQLEKNKELLNTKLGKEIIEQIYRGKGGNELEDSIRSFYTDWHDEDMSSHNTMAGIPIGAPIILTGTSLKDTWDDADFTFGSGDFTLECWAYQTANSSWRSLMMKYDSTESNASWYWALNTGVNNFYFY